MGGVRVGGEGGGLMTTITTMTTMTTTTTAHAMTTNGNDDKQL